MALDIFKQDAVGNGKQVKFLKIGSNMACFIKSTDNYTKGILNLLEFSHIIFIYAIE